MTPARQVLLRLLQRGESARMKAGSGAASIVMSSKRDAKEYHALLGLSDLEMFHAEIALAEREGAISVQRDRYRGDGQGLLRITTSDLDALAAFLGLESHASRMEHASRALTPLLCSLPALAVILDAWAAGRRVCGYEVGSDAVTDVLDAARVMLELPQEAGSERVLRSESVRIFGNSKRLEKLTPWLCVLVSGELSSGLHAEEVWAMLGLRRAPQPLLVSGRAILRLQGGACFDLPWPYLGVSMEALEGVTTQARYMLTVENLASFHEIARLQPDGLVIYTGGMPSPAWRCAFKRVLRGVPNDAWIGHWGDIDEGGFRISAVLAEDVKSEGRRLHPWLMSPDELPAAVAAAGVEPTAAQLSAMQRNAIRSGWEMVADALKDYPLILEQEAIPARLPKVP